jgi:hypothetical protein
VKLGTENKKKTMVAGALLVLAVALLVYQFSGGGNDAPAPAQNSAQSPMSQAAKSVHKHSLMAHSLDPTLRFDLLKSSEDVSYKGTGRNIFRSEAPPPPAPIPSPTDPALTDKGPPPPPPPPPIDLKFYGYEGPKNGNKRVFLLKGEDIFLAKEGDIVDRRYKIMHVGPSSVEVQDVLTNHTQTIPLTAG